MNDKKIVTRIAPSPTGEMHIGTVRTALFNYIFAKQHGGEYFVRIEDTDRERNKEEWVDAIWRDFEWVGLAPDKKFRQSQHVARHTELLQKLVTEDKAYISREPKKDDPAQEVEVVRLRNPGTTITFTDLIRGEVTFDTAELKDFVIARSITDPLYHFAVVADDGDAGVTHVLRAEEHISNTPRQILILEALGFERPIYAHFPLILAPDRSKLSKRKHAASVEQYRAQGFLPEAMINYLALLGWNPGGEQELFTMEDLMKLFSFERMHKAGAVFDIEKFLWFNREHIKKLSMGEFKTRYSAWAGEMPEFGEKVWEIVKNSASTFKEAQDQFNSGHFNFLKGDITVSPELLVQGAKTDAAGAKTHLEKVLELLRTAETTTAESVKELIFPYATEVGRASVLWPMRVALSGQEKSPDPFTLVELLGRETSLSRIEKALSML